MKLILQISMLFFLFLTNLSFGQNQEGEKEVIIQKIIIDKASGDSTIIVIDDITSTDHENFVFKSDDGNTFVVPPMLHHPHAKHFAWTDSLSGGQGFKYFYKFDGDSIDFDFDFDFAADSSHAVWFSHKPGNKMVWNFEDSLIQGKHEYIVKEIIDGKHIEKIITITADKIPHKEMQVHAFHMPEDGKQPRVVIIQKDGVETIEIEENDSITVVGAGDKQVEVFVYKTKAGDTKIEVTSLDKKELKSLTKEQKLKGEPTLDISDFVVKPNPNNGRFRLSFNLPSEETANLKIVDSVGKTVFAKKTTGSSVDEYIDISNDSKGVFFIIVEQVSKFCTRKVFIE